jgi:hypothetical protein
LNLLYSVSQMKSLKSSDTVILNFTNFNILFKKTGFFLECAKISDNFKGVLLKNQIEIRYLLALNKVLIQLIGYH